LIRYLKGNIGKKIHNMELREVSGLDDVPRTIRGLRQQGWDIDVFGDGYVRLNSATLRRTGKRRTPVSRRLRYLTFHKSDFRCRACGASVKDGAKLEVDHIIPVDWGGTNDEGNLQALCQACNAGKKAWIAGQPADLMKAIFERRTVETRIEGLFDAFPNQDIPSTMIQLVSRGAMDWQRALRRIRERTGKKIIPTQGLTAYRYVKGQRADVPPGR